MSMPLYQHRVVLQVEEPSASQIVSLEILWLKIRCKKVLHHVGFGIVFPSHLRIVISSKFLLIY